MSRLVWRIRQLDAGRTRLGPYGSVLLGLLLAEVAAGAGMYYLAVPAFLQPIHLLLAAVAAGLQLMMAVVYRWGASDSLSSGSAQVTGGL